MVELVRIIPVSSGQLRCRDAAKAESLKEAFTVCVCVCACVHAYVHVVKQYNSTQH